MSRKWNQIRRLDLNIQVAETDWPKWLLNFFEIDFERWPDKHIKEYHPKWICKDPACNQRGCYYEEWIVPCIRERTFEYSEKELPWYVVFYLHIVQQIRNFRDQLTKIGISIHDPISGTCTWDFKCCQKEWQGTKYENFLHSVSKAAKEDQQTLTIQKPENPN